MNLFNETFAYFLADQERFVRLLGQHLVLSAAALAIALLVCLPLGIYIAHRPAWSQPVINGFNTLRIVPSLVILFLALPYLGLGFRPALVALTVLACPPILINTYAAIRGVGGGHARGCAGRWHVALADAAAGGAAAGAACHPHWRADWDSRGDRQRHSCCLYRRRRTG